MGKPKHTCSIEGCGRPAYKGKMCWSHQERVKKHGTHLRPCAECGNDIAIGTRPATQICGDCNKCKVPGCGRDRRRYGYCNTHSGRYRLNGNIIRKCKRCDEDIHIEDGAGLRYCSDACRIGECSVERCSREVLAKGFCKRHYKRMSGSGNPLRPCKGCGEGIPVERDGRSQFCDEGCKPRCRAPGCNETASAYESCSRHANTISRYGYFPDLDFDCWRCGVRVQRSHADRQQTHNRKSCEDCSVRATRNHKWFRDEVLTSGAVDCSLCGDPINFDLAHPDPHSLSIDHTLPLTRGGTNLRRNLAPAHLVCNIRKGNRIAPKIEGVLTLF